MLKTSILSMEVMWHDSCRWLGDATLIVCTVYYFALLLHRAICTRALERVRVRLPYPNITKYVDFQSSIDSEDINSKVGFASSWLINRQSDIFCVCSVVKYEDSLRFLKPFFIFLFKMKRLMIYIIIRFYRKNNRKIKSFRVLWSSIFPFYTLQTWKMKLKSHTN